MRIENKTVKTNEQFLTELNEGKISPLNIICTPYENLRILLDTREVDDSYRDEDGYLIHSTKTIIDRKALLKYDGGNYTFLFDNWFDDIDFEIGLYAKVRLGRLYDFISPLGEYLFSYWYEDIESHDNGLFYCYTESKARANSVSEGCANNDKQDNRVCSIYNKRGLLLHQSVIAKTGFIYGKAIISKDGLCNYIDEDGNVLSEDWFIDARPFEEIGEELFAFVRNEDGWGVINHNGDYAYHPRFSDIKAECSYDFYNCKSIAIIAIVDDGNGQNVLMHINNCSEESSEILTLGLHENVDSIYLIGCAYCILVRSQGEWGIYRWDYNNNKYDCSVKIGKLDSVEEKLYRIYGRYYKLVKKDGMFNVVGTNGIIFKEWYSEILVYGNLLKVKRPLEALKVNKNDKGGEDTPLFEFNLISLNGSYELKEWVGNLIVTPFDEAFLVNIKPKLNKCSDGSIIDVSVTRESVQIDRSCVQRIKKIEGLCNIILGDLLFSNWHDGLEFLNGHIFTDGYLKVWNNNKCNLIDKQGEYVSREWLDDFVTSHWWHTDSYFCNLKSNAFLVRMANKVNLLFNGKYVLNRWFTEIKYYIEPYASDKYSKKAFFVRDGDMSGIYYLGTGLLGTGLVGGRLYDTIKRISEDLYFCRFDNEGHIMSLDGRIITNASIHEVQPFHNGYAMVTTDCIGCSDRFKYNFINTEGHIVLPVWLDSDINMRFAYSKEEQPRFFKVSKDYKYNLLTQKKQFVFKKWYDSISGDDGKWVISDESRGELKFNFIDNCETLLSDEWFKGIRTLSYLDNNVYVVESERGYNIFNGNNELVLPRWSKHEIYDDDDSRLAVIEIYGSGSPRYYYLDHSGHLITPYWSFNDSVKRYCRNVGENREEILILGLHDDDFCGGYMHIICKSDGTPFFKNIIHRPYSSHISCYDDSMTSIFGSIEEYSVPDSDPVLLVNKHWPVKNNDVNQFVIMDYSGNELSEEFERIGKFDNEGYALVERSGRFNIINKNFSLISSLWFNNLGYEYKTKETEYGEIIDHETYTSDYIPYQVEKVRRNTSFHNGYIKVELAGSFNLMNQAGALNFSIWYDSMTILPYGYYKVGLNGLFNIVDVSNRPVSDVWFDHMYICKMDHEKIIYAGKKGKHYRLLFIRKSSALLSDDWFDKVYRYDKADKYYPVCLDGKKDFILDNGKLLVPGWHDDQLLFRESDGVYVVVKDVDKFNIFSSCLSKMLSDSGFENVLSGKSGLFNYGWCGVKVDGKYTFVNKLGCLQKGRFDSIREYICGYAGVVIDGKKNYVSSDGNLLSEVWFDEISAFAMCKKAVVKINGKLNIIDSSGTLLLSDEIQNVSSIGFVKSDYCLLSFASGCGKTIEKYYDFKTGHQHYSESDVIYYLDNLKPDNVNPCLNGDTGNSADEAVADNPEVEKRNKKISDLIINRGAYGINYTLVRFGNKSNLIDKNGFLVFEEWIDSSSIQMCQGVPLMMNVDNKWIIVK